VLFGDDRLAEVVGAAKSFAPSHVCKLVRAAVSAFEAGAPQADDITVLALQYLAPPRVFSRLFHATREGISDATAFLDEAMESVGLAGTKHAAALNIILDEITSNIVKHSGAHGFEVDITVVENPSSVTLVISDDGTPYHPLGHVDPDTTLSAEERPIGGLGILMVKKMSNSVVYTRGHNRNILKIVKNIPLPAAE
jgi:sigma-B regulation protein RsbU (phosphoserine phosphatase)